MSLNVQLGYSRQNALRTVNTPLLALISLSGKSTFSQVIILTHTSLKVAQLPEKDKLNWSKAQLLARLDVAMGGRVAEEIIFGKDREHNYW